MRQLEGGARCEIDLPFEYRLVCQDLALAQQRGFGATLVDRLNALSLRGHQQLYRASAGGGSGVIAFLAVTFPRAVRREWRLLVLLSVLFYGTCLLLFALGRMDPSTVNYVLSPGDLSSYERMYGPADATETE